MRTVGSTGRSFGKILSKISDGHNAKGRCRSRLHALEKQHRAAGKNTKAQHIRKYNLGQQKQKTVRARGEATLARIINTGLNTLLQTRKPSVLITEDLRHAFTFNKPKGLNRRLSGWVKGVLQDRVEFKALAEGFRHEKVNPAYGSPACPRCDFVDARNRVRGSV